MKKVETLRYNVAAREVEGRDEQVRELLTFCKYNPTVTIKVVNADALFFDDIIETIATNKLNGFEIDEFESTIVYAEGE